MGRNSAGRRLGGWLGLLSVLFVGSVLAAGERPLILLSNDDGVGAPGLEAVYRQVKDLGEVVVVAPAENQSSISHSISAYEPIYIKPYRIDGVEVGYSLSTTPATCVIVALDQLLPRKPDLVISGINRGANPGWVAYLSGTVSVARQAAMCGVRAMAVSMESAESADYQPLAKALRPLVEKLLVTDLPPDVFLNVNAKALPEYPKGIRWTKDSRVELVFSFQRTVNNQHRELFWANGKFPDKSYPEDTDMGAMQAGYIAVAFLTCNQEARIDGKPLAGKLGLLLPE